MLRPGGTALVVGPVPPRRPRAAPGWPSRGCCSRPRRVPRVVRARRASRTSRTRGWRAGLVPRPACRYAVAVSGASRAAGGRRSRARERLEDVREPMDARRPRSPGASLLGSLAGAVVRAGRRRAALRSRPAGAMTAAAGDVAASPRGRGRSARCGASRARTRSSARRSASSALYLIAVDTLPGWRSAAALCDLVWTLVAGLAVNVYIVGINQLEDVEIDRVNKPFLPLAAGEMTVRRGARDRGAVRRRRRRAGAHAGRGGDGRGRAAAWRSARPTRSPPLRLKRFPALAVAVHLRRALGRGQPRRLRALLARARRTRTGSIPGAGVGADAVRAAVLVRDRDPQGRPRRRGRPALPDRDLHRAARGRARASHRAGRAAAAYVGMAVLGPLLLERPSPWVLAVGHLAALAVLWRLRAAGRPDDAASSRASTCACGSCSSSSTCSCR